MKKSFARLVAFLAAFAVVSLVVPTPANAGLLALKRFGASGETISGQTLAAQRSLAIGGDDLTGYDVIIIWVTITDADNSETGVQVDCYGQQYEGGPTYRIPACVWDASNTRYNCEAGPLFWNPSDETTPKRQIFRYVTLGSPDATCTFTFTGGSASDTIDANIYGGTSG